MTTSTPTAKYDWSKTSLGPTRLLETTENPLHVAIVQNYRRHYLLEMAGRYSEIFVPEMSVPTPQLRYNFSIQGLDRPIVGQEVVDMYAATHFQVFPEDEVVAVHDWGIASESTMHQYATASTLQSAGIDIEASDKWYIMSYQIAMVWHFTNRGRMIGENGYHQFWSIKVEEAPHYDLSKEQINAELNKLISLYELEWRATLLP
jgi:hypothetical protein